MGRDALTADEHWAKGTTSEARTEPEEFRAGRPKCPQWVKDDAAALEVWKRMCSMLAGRGTLTKADGPALELYVQHSLDLAAARAEVKAHGMFVDVVVLDSSGEPHTTRKENPAQKVVARIASAMHQLLQQFGATPVARRRTRPVKVKDVKPSAVPGTMAWYVAHADNDESRGVSVIHPQEANDEKQ